MRRSSVRRLLNRASKPARPVASQSGVAVLAASPTASTSRNTIEYELQALAQQHRIFKAYLHSQPAQVPRLAHPRHFSASARARRGRTVQQAEDAAESGGAPQHVSERLLRKFAETPPNYGERKSPARV